MIKRFLLTLCFVVVVWLGASTVVKAGTDLTVSCPAIGSCDITPAATPLYNEAGWIPGSTITQRLRITNTSGQSGFASIQANNYSETNALGQVIALEIHRDTPGGTLIYSAPNLTTFKNDGYFTISGINPGQTIDFYFIATMSPSAGNEYQGSMLKFDLLAGLELTSTPPPSGGGGGTSGGGSVNGATTQAQPPVCSDQTPTSAPILTVVSSGANTVTLSWTSASPVAHYGLFFTRSSDGAQYGASNIGNVTSYTVTNLAGGQSYTFQVFGINGCAPGPRSNSSNTGQVAGGAVTGRPLGPGGQVLGTTTATTSAQPSPSLVSSAPSEGEVAGVSTEMCTNWRQYVPWIILIAQLFLALFAEYFFRHEGGWRKHLVSVVITIASIVIFYLIRDCQCVGQWSWLAWLCKWYWIVAVILALLIKGFGYAFLDESGEKETPPAQEKKT